MAKKKSLPIFKLLLLAGGGYLAWQAYKVNDFMKKVTFTISKIKFKSATNIEISLDVVNSSLQTFQYEGFTGNAIYKGTNLSSIVSNDKKPLPPSSSTAITMNVVLNSNQVLNQLADLILGGGVLDPIRIIGTLIINGAKVPIDQQKEITI